MSTEGCRFSELPIVERSALALSVLVPVYNERYVLAPSLCRLLELDHPSIASLEVIVVDDGSTDGSYEVLTEIAAKDDRVQLRRHPQNQGKGAAIRTALSHATGDVTICHDADLEYDPEDIPRILEPFIKEGADAVYGSRYMTGHYRRALMFRHTWMNMQLTTLANWLTDLHLTDLETCYKAVRTSLFKSLPLRCDDFRIEVELTFKLAKRNARMFEVPIRYVPRSRQEGKKIGALDGLRALMAMGRFSLVDDMFQDDDYGARILAEMEHARRFNLWMADTLRPFVGDRVLEIGAGIGTLSHHFIPRERYVVSDLNDAYLGYLRSLALGRPYLSVRRIDVTQAEDFAGLDGAFDTALIVNVLEHVVDEHAALTNLYRCLAPGGRCVVLVPHHPWLYGTLDEALDHRERYTIEHLEQAMESVGFQKPQTTDFNRFAVPGWWVNGKLLRRRSFSRVQLKLINTLMPALRRIDDHLPWSGQSIIGVGVKP